MTFPKHLSLIFCLLSANALVVRPAKNTAADIHGLADLRYNEWIKDVYPDTSQSGFRMATADLFYERKAQGAVSFLAMERAVIGAAEMSPIEVQGVCDAIDGLLYVTDVVTAKNHHRKGVAKALMNTVEDAAAEKSCPLLLLHVESSNLPAIEFYRKLGYCEPQIDLDTKRLEENAGTQGKVLLGKTLTPSRDKQRRLQRGGGFAKGFGKTNQSSRS